MLPCSLPTDNLLALCTSFQDFEACCCYSNRVFWPLPIVLGWNCNCNYTSLFYECILKIVNAYSIHMQPSDPLYTNPAAVAYTGLAVISFSDIKCDHSPLFYECVLTKIVMDIQDINKTEPLCTNPYRIQQVYMHVAYPQLAIISFSTIYHPIHCSRTHTINFVYYRLSKWYTEARWIIGCKKRACPQTI